MLSRNWGRLASCLLAPHRNSGIKLAGGGEVENREGGSALQYDHTDIKMLLFFQENKDL